MHPVRLCVPAHVYVYAPTCLHAHTCVRKHMSARACVYTCVHVCTCVCELAGARACLHVRTHMQALWIQVGGTLSKGAPAIAASLAASISKAVEAAEADMASLNLSDSVRVYARMHGFMCLCVQARFVRLCAHMRMQCAHVGA